LAADAHADGAPRGDASENWCALAISCAQELSRAISGASGEELERLNDQMLVLLGLRARTRAFESKDAEFKSAVSRLSEFRRKALHNDHPRLSPIHDIDVASLKPLADAGSTGHGEERGERGGDMQGWIWLTHSELGVWANARAKGQVTRGWTQLRTRLRDVEQPHKFLWFRALCEARWSCGYNTASGYFDISTDGARRYYDERVIRWLAPLTMKDIHRRELQSATVFPLFYRAFLRVCHVPNRPESRLQLTDWHTDIGPEREQGFEVERNCLKVATLLALQRMDVDALSPILHLVVGYCQFRASGELDAYGRLRSIKRRLEEARQESAQLINDGAGSYTEGSPFIAIARSPLYHYYVCGTTLNSSRAAELQDEYKLDYSHRDEYQRDADEPSSYDDVSAWRIDEAHRRSTFAKDIAEQCQHVFVIRGDCCRGRTERHPCSVAPNLQTFLLTHFTDFAHRSRQFSPRSDFDSAWKPIQNPSDCAFPMLYQATPIPSFSLGATLVTPPTWLCS
jgi:hypothetical protein